MRNRQEGDAGVEMRNGVGSLQDSQCLYVGCPEHNVTLLRESCMQVILYNAYFYNTHLR